MTDPRNLENINFKAVSNFPNNLQVRFDPTSEQPDYIGQAPYGAATSDQVWTIYKLTYSGSFVTLKQTAMGAAWDDRASVTYA